MENNITNEQIVLRLARRVTRLCTEEGEYVPSERYSGRGMFGRHSIFAFTSNVHPTSVVGESLLRKGELTWDNMGKEFIYYSRITD
jgi:hypothetical protein